MNGEIQPRSELESAASLPPSSFQPIERSRLIPQISIRMLFVFTFAGAVLYALARAAGEGGAIATAFMVAVVYLVAMFAALAICFLIALSFSVLWKRGDPDLLEGSPFAEDQLPPQWLPPREKEA